MWTNDMGKAKQTALSMWRKALEPKDKNGTQPEYYSETETAEVSDFIEDTFGKIPEQQIKVHDITFLQQVFQPDVMVLLQQVDVTELGTPSLTGHVRKSVARPGTDPDGIGKADTTVHKVVEHAARKNTTHASPFQHKAAVTVYMYHFLHKHKRTI